MNALELQGLTKHYKDFTLGPLDLTLPGGTICGLIGENGAGKSTTIRLILDMGAAGRRHGDDSWQGQPHRFRPHQGGRSAWCWAAMAFPVPERCGGGQGDGGHLPQLGRW